jgi:hypothetical protein
MYEDQIHRALGVFEHKNNVREHYHCLKNIFDLHKTKEQLKALIERPDVDTICAHDYVKMKKNALAVNGLHYKDFNPAAQGITVPVFPEL